MSRAKFFDNSGDNRIKKNLQHIFILVHINTSHNKILIQVIRSSVMGQNIITRFSVLYANRAE